MKRKIWTLLLILSVLFVTMGGPAPKVTASPSAVAPNLGTAAGFVGLAATTFTNTGAGVYYGHVGVSPGSAVVGFPPGEIRNGAIHAADGIALQAQLDATTAYNDLAGRTCNINLTSQDLGGMTLQPGVYCFNSSAALTGDLVLDALGDPHAIWVFQIASTLTTAPNSTVRLINGGQLLNVFWQVGSSATFNSNTRFKGNVIAEASISMNAGASLVGRAIALSGAVTMDTDGSPPIANTPLSIVKLVSPPNAIPDQVITYTLTFTNFGNEPVKSITITDQIPISVTDTSVISSGVAITQVNSSPYEWAIPQLEANQSGSITITGHLSLTLPGGSFTNTAVITATDLKMDPENDHSSAVMTIAPQLLSPVDGMVTDTTMIRFTWAPSNYVAGYWFSLNGNPVNVGNVTEYSRMLASGAYTWTVAAYDSHSTMSAYAPPWAFAITETLPVSYTISPIMASEVYTFGPNLCGSIWFTDTGGITSLVITYTYQYPSVNANGLIGQYRIVPTSGGGYQAAVTLCYQDADLAVSGIDPAEEENLHAYRYTGATNWQEYSRVDTVANTVTADNVTQFGVFGLGIAAEQPTALATRGLLARGGLGLALASLLLTGLVVMRRRKM